MCCKYFLPFVGYVSPCFKAFVDGVPNFNIVKFIYHSLYNLCSFALFKKCFTTVVVLSISSDVIL